MKRQKIFVLLLLCLLARTSIAQNPLAPAYLHFFDPVDKTQIQSDYLFDYTIPISCLERLDGIRDTVIHSKEWLAVYDQLRNSRISGTSALPSVQQLEDSCFSYYQQGKNLLLVINHNYDRIKQDAFSTNLLSVDSANLQINDVPGRISSPYEAHRVFAASPAYLVYGNGNVVFRLDSDFYFSENSTLPGIEIDFGDGLGFRSVSWNSDILVNYNSTLDSVIVQLRTTGSNQLIAKSVYEPVGISLSDKFGASGPVATPPTTFLDEQPQWITADIPYNGETLKGYVTVSYAYNQSTGVKNTQLTKPVILVEGIDFGFEGKPWGINSWNKCGSLGYIDIRYNQQHIYHDDGSHDTKPWEYNLFEYGPQLIGDINGAGYDFIYLDFDKGAEYMQKNAFVLVKLIQTINSMKQGCDPIVVVGASMGGQVARYALTYMETNNIEADVREFVSFDSPNLGADISIGLQYFVDYYADRFGDPQGTLEDLGRFEDNRHRKLDAIAAKQLLKYHFRQSGDHDPLRTTFMSELNSMGSYPNVRKVAIANGSGYGTGQGFDPGDEIIEMHIPISSLTLAGVGAYFGWSAGAVIGYLIGEYVVHDYDAHIYSTMNGSTNVFSGTAPFHAWESKSSHSNTLPFNSAPGGQNDNTGASEFPTGLKLPVMQGLLIDAKTNFTGFIPTISSLALKAPYDQNPYQDIDALVQAYSTDYSIFTPFDDIYYPSTNEPHVNIKPVNSTWFLDELQMSDFQLSYLPLPQDPSKHTYNFGNKIHRILNTVSINNGGTLSVNLAGGTEYLDPQLPSVSGSHYEVITTFCAGVSINNGGQFIVGDPSVGNTATVKFRSGSSLTIGSGGKLIIKDGSRVVIEKGARLNFVSGAEIQLLGDNAVLEFEGDLEVGSGATFTFTYPNSTSGFVKFSPGYNEYNIKMLAGPAAINFQGSGYTDKVVEVSTESMYIPSACTDFDIQYGTVELGANARVAVIGAATNINITNSIFTSTVNGGNSHRGLHLFGQPNVNITSSFFEKGQFGIYAPLFYIGSPLTLTGVTFRECSTGLFTQGKGVSMNNVQFYDNAIGWEGKLMAYPSNLEEVTAGSSSTGSNITGIAYEGGANAALNIDNSIISNNSEGIWMESATLKMSCSQVNENVSSGLFLDNFSALDISGEPGGGGGFVDLSKNSPGSTTGYAIRLDVARDMFLNNGYNKITPAVAPGTHCEDLSTGCVKAIYGTMIKDYSEGCNFDCSDIHIPAYNNEWIFTSTAPRWNDEYWTVTNYLCTDQFGVPISQRKIILDADPMAEYVSCEEYTEPDPGNAERSIFSNCDECGTVSSEDFNKVPFAEAILTAINTMSDTTVQDPNKTAVSYFVQILSGVYASSASQSKQNLMSYARNQMLDALSKAVQNDEILISDNYPLISAEVEAVINLLQDIIDHTPCDPGYHERLGTSMQIAQIYHLVDRRDLALDQLYEIATWVGSDNTEYVEKWTCAIEVENMLLLGQLELSAFDSAMAVCQGTSNRVASNESVEDNSSQTNESLVSIVPNPNNGNMSIEYKIDEQQPGRIVLYDITGKIVFQSAVSSGDGKLEINVGHLTEGVYFFQVFSGEKAVAQDKLVIIK